jgi:hypothetical protein
MELKINELLLLLKIASFLLPFLGKRRGFKNISLIFVEKILTPYYAPILVEISDRRASLVYTRWRLAAGGSSASHPE